MIAATRVWIVFAVTLCLAACDERPAQQRAEEECWLRCEVVNGTHLCTKNAYRNAFKYPVLGGPVYDAAFVDGQPHMCGAAK